MDSCWKLIDKRYKFNNHDTRTAGVKQKKKIAADKIQIRLNSITVESIFVDLDVCYLFVDPIKSIERFANVRVLDGLNKGLFQTVLTEFWTGILCDKWLENCFLFVFNVIAERENAIG